ncbi:MAG: hypothetical protein ACK55Z_05630, partial [bacterium]
MDVPKKTLSPTSARGRAPNPGAHIKLFLTTSQETGISETTQRLCEEFANIEENRYATPPSDVRPADRAMSGRRLTWASLNVRSIYGRERILMNFMRDNQINVLALQETFERHNDPP